MIFAKCVLRNNFILCLVYTKYLIRMSDQDTKFNDIAAALSYCQEIVKSYLASEAESYVRGKKISLPLPPVKFFFIIKYAKT